MSDFDPLPDFGAALEHVLRERAAAPSSEVMPDFHDALDRELRRRAAIRASFAEVMPDFHAVLERELRRRAAAEPSFEVMPDLLVALENDLRRQARASARRPARRHQRSPLHWRRPAFAAALALSLLVQAVMVGGPVVHETPAFGSPPILESRAVATPGDLARRGILGTLRATSTETRVIAAFGEQAYFVHGGDYWCLFIYDGDAKQDREPVASCAHTATLFRIGISVKVGHRYMAVLPGEVPAPILEHADGSTETLQPTEQGVVTVGDMRPGDRIILHGTDGRTRVDRNRALDEAADPSSSDDTEG